MKTFNDSSGVEGHALVIKEGLSARSSILQASPSRNQARPAVAFLTQRASGGTETLMTSIISIQIRKLLRCDLGHRNCSSRLERLGGGLGGCWFISNQFRAGKNPVSLTSLERK